jgi:hypothetical protein
VLLERSLNSNFRRHQIRHSASLLLLIRLGGHVSVSQMFESFAAALQLPTTKKLSISSRTATISRRLNKDFRETDSDTANRFYGGSYGRNTAVDSLSDMDLLYVLPELAP